MSQPLNTEPRDLLLDSHNDLVIENGDFVLARGLDAVMQSCRVALQMFEDEWFLNQDAGIPYWQDIIAQKPDVAVRAATIAFTSELLALPDISAVTRMDVTFDPKTRRLTVRWAVRTSLGDTPTDTLDVALA